MGEPPVLFEEDIFQNEASKIFARSGLKATTGSPEMAMCTKKMLDIKKIVYFGGLLNL